MNIERIMEFPYWIIDILPKCVPDDRSTIYSKVEQYYLSQPQITELHRKQAEIIIKLSCYYDIQLSTDNGENFSKSALPDDIEKQFIACVGTKSLYISIESPECLITLDGCDTYMTVYTFDEEVAELIGVLARSVGLFTWTS
ncbi:MAG: hypothetical protein GXY08_11715 [Ruminococcus sp.]|nr:hypothetical protein [Ruminococcus sp.]